MNDESVNVYQLNGVMDIKEYEGFGWENTYASFTGGSLAIDDFVPRFRDGEWYPKRLRDVWQAKAVAGDVADWNDYPTINLSTPCFSKRAADALIDLLEPNGELLPVIYKGKQDYFAYNITTIADVLDVEHSVIRHKIDRYAFEADNIKDLSIFRLKNEATFQFVTQAFVDRVIEQKLNGFSFDRIWPLPSSVDWWREHKKDWGRRRDKVARLRRKAGVKRLPYPPLEPGE